MSFSEHMTSSGSSLVFYIISFAAFLFLQKMNHAPFRGFRLLQHSKLTYMRGSNYKLLFYLMNSTVGFFRSDERNHYVQKSYANLFHSE